MTLTASTIAPALQYADAVAAIDWLCQVFGFDRHAVYPGAGNRIEHAELTLGAGMVMLGSIRPDAAPHRQATPSSINLVVADVDAVYARALSAGAEIVEPLEDKSYGGRGFACLDPARHVWHVGTYDPWAAK